MCFSACLTLPIWNGYSPSTNSLRTLQHPTLLHLPTIMEVLDYYSPAATTADNYAINYGLEPAGYEFEHYQPRTHVAYGRGFYSRHAWSSATAWPNLTINNCFPELLLGQIISHAYKTRDAARRDLHEKIACYAGISEQHVENAAFLVAAALGLQNCERVTTTLTYEQSLHVRAELPNGAGSVHVSVLFTPGLDPTQATGEREEEDNTVISVFGRDGKFVVSTEGPLLPALTQLPALLTSSRIRGAMAA